jgi:hypothetical protein
LFAQHPVVKGEGVKFENAPVEINDTRANFRHLCNLAGADVLKDSIHRLASGKISRM